MGFQATMYGSQKSHYPWLKCHKHEEKLTMTMFWEMTIESKLLNKFHWSWYLSFRRQCFIHEDDEMKKCYIFEYQSNENQAFRFFWDTRYSIQAFVNHMLITYMYGYKLGQLGGRKVHSSWVNQSLQDRISEEHKRESGNLFQCSTFHPRSCEPSAIIQNKHWRMKG